MGVKDLWAILAPAMVPVPLADLKGQTLAVDLSIWIVETQGVRQMQGVVTKPYLRNLFFRINHLLQLGINLIFVIEGEAPKLKWETMAQRTQARYGGAGRGRGNLIKKPPTRSHFNAVIKECCQLLDAIGIPYVQSAGEAEAKCAFLNAKGIVNGCLTDDGDVFLYGARKVYRNFTMKDPHIESYDMVDIEEKLGLDQSHMIALGLLLGCDYVPKGVPGVGREMALKFFKHIGKANALERFDIWVKNKKHYAQLEATSSAKKPPHCNQCKHPGSAREHDRRGCTLCHSSQHCEPQPYDYTCPCDWHSKQREVSASAVELNIQKRAIQTNGFPWKKVVEEFKISRDKVPRNQLSWLCPRLNPFIHFCETKMEWVEDYSREKLLPLMTLWGMRSQLGIYGKNGKQFLEPHCIVKQRVRLGVPCFEVQWHKLSEDSTFKEDHYTTIEEADIFRQCFPETVLVFEARKPVKTKRNHTKAKAEVGDKENVDLSDITTAVSDMKISEEKTLARKSPADMGQRKVEEICISGSEEGVTSLDEVSEGKKVRGNQCANASENRVLSPCHEQNMKRKKEMSEPLSPLNSQYMNSHKAKESWMTQQPSILHRQNCSSSVTAHLEIEDPKTLDVRFSDKSSSDEEEYLPLSQRLALLPKINKMPVDIKTKKASSVYRVNNKSTAVKVSLTSGKDTVQGSVHHNEPQTTENVAQLGADVPQTRSNGADVLIQKRPDCDLVFENGKTEENSIMISGDCLDRCESRQARSILIPEQRVVEPSESELISRLKQCSLQNIHEKQDKDTTDITPMPPSASESLEKSTLSLCKNPGEVVKKDESSSMSNAKYPNDATSAKKCVSKRSGVAGGKKKLVKGKVRKSSKPWYTESVLEFSSDDDLVFELPANGERGTVQTAIRTEHKTELGSLTDGSEMIIKDKSNCINDSNLDEGNFTGIVYQEDKVKGSHDKGTRFYTKSDLPDILNGEGKLCPVNGNVPQEDGLDVDASFSEQSVEKETCSVLEGGFIREDTIDDGLDDSSNLSHLEGGFFRESPGSVLLETSTNSSEHAGMQTDLNLSSCREAHPDSTYNSFISTAVQETSFEHSATDLFDNSSKGNCGCEMILPVKDFSVDSFLNETPTVVFVDTPCSSPFTEVDGMKDLHKIEESKELKISSMEKPVSTTAADDHVTWNRSQFGHFSMGCTLLDITSTSDKPDTSRHVADTCPVSPVQDSTNEANDMFEFGPAEQILSLSVPKCSPCGPMIANGKPFIMMSPVSDYSASCDAMSPVSTNNAQLYAMSVVTTEAGNTSCDSMSPPTAYSAPNDAKSPSTTNNKTESGPGPVSTSNALFSVLGSVTDGNTITDVTSPDSALCDDMIPDPATEALRADSSPTTAKSDLNNTSLPMMTSSSADTSVFAAASPIPLAQRLMNRVGSQLLTQFSQPSHRLQAHSQPWAQQSTQYRKTQPLKSKSIEFDDSDITLLGIE